MVRGLYFAFVLGLWVSSFGLTASDLMFWLLIFGGNIIYQILPKGE